MKFNSGNIHLDRVDIANQFQGQDLAAIHGDKQYPVAVSHRSTKIHGKFYAINTHEGLNTI